MRKEIQRNNSFAAFSAAEPTGSWKSRSRTQSAGASISGQTKNHSSILKENADKLGQLARV